ncbi:hypothetical protein LSPH24S_09277 [Lysinibacillus sphaericus]
MFCGATGTGKTTSLYSLIHLLATSQTYSMHHKDYIFIKFEPHLQRYSIKKDFFTTEYTRPFPKGVELLTEGTNVYTVRFNFIGNMMTPGTLYFHTPQGLKKVVITLGRGRMRVE